jgi:hypothetical protein
MASMEQTKPRRRWLKFSLGGLLLAITLLCLLFGWQADRVARQRRAVEMVERLGGYVAYEHQWYESPPFSHYNPRIEPRGPRWLRGLVGEDWFRTVALVSFERGIGADRTTASVPKPVTIAEWKLLSHLRGLKTLRVTHQPSTDHEVRHLARMTQLEELTLDGAEISDEGLRQLGRLISLRELTIGNDSVVKPALPGITDRGLGYLTSLRNLTTLGLGPTHATEAGLQQLGSLRSLESLQIGLPAGTPAELTWLRRCPKLKTLILSGVHVADEGWKSLAACRGLENLGFSDCQLSGDGLSKLRHLELGFLWLSQTPVFEGSLRGFDKLGAVYLIGLEVPAELLRPLEHSPELHFLSLSQCTVRDEDFAMVPALATLRFLTLTDTTISDAGLEGVNRQPELRYLDLNGTQVTDAGLASLNVPNLVSVDVRGTKVTEAGAERFRQRTGAQVITDASPAGP